MRDVPERLFALFAWGAALGLIAGVGLLLAVLAVRGGATLGPELFFGDAAPLAALLGRTRVFDGIWPAMVGTIVLVAASSLLAIPLGVASGIYAAAYAPARLRRAFDLAIDVLAGVPSIVMGLFGFAGILLLRRTLAADAGTGLWLSATCIALLVTPYLIRTTQGALVALPEGLRVLGPGLGLSRWQSLRWILVPSSGPGILSGVMLAIGRAAEDTAVIMLTGVVYNAGLPAGLGAKYEALPFRIYVIGAEYRSQEQLAQGFGCALVLLVITAGLLGLAALFQRGMHRRWRR